MIPSIDTITTVEDRYYDSEEQSLGEAFKLWDQRWKNGAHDRETAFRLAFLAWYARTEPNCFTGLPDDVDTPTVFSEAFVSLGGEASSDPETCYVFGAMARMFPWALEDEIRWETVGKKLTAKARLASPEGVKLEWFKGRGAYGHYFSHIFSGARLGLED
jgi:hypothetical protein